MKRTTNRNTLFTSKFLKNIHELYHLCLFVKDTAEDDGESLGNLRNWLATKSSSSSSSSSSNSSRGKSSTNANFIRAAATYQGYDNMTPLHLVLGRGVPIDVVQMLVQQAPETLRMKNSNGKIPLHLACRFGASLEILDLLLTNYPQGLEVRDNNDKRPSCFLSINDYHSNSITKNKKNPFLLHRVISGGFSIPLVQLLLQALPESCTVSDENGMIPLHHACYCANKKKVTESMEIISLLLEANPGSYQIKDNMGRTPSALLSLEQTTTMTNGRYLLHRQAANKHLSSTNTNSNSGIHLLRFLVHTYPDSIQQPDHHGMLPFHHACLNPTNSLDVLMLLLTLYPDCVASS